MQCIKPIRIRNGVFPCGKCIACRIAKSREWAFRLTAELPYWKHAVFVTLTYDDKFLPEGNTLRKEHLQLFFKRLRKNSHIKLKYYACGEYGSNEGRRSSRGVWIPPKDYGTGLGRPHYHAIIFGLGQLQSHKEFIKNSWRFCDWSIFNEKKAFGNVTYDSCRYVTDYIFKKYSGELAKEVYESKGVEVPFKLSSTGLGLRFCLDNGDNIRANGITSRGVTIATPRYFVDKLGIQLLPQDEKRIEQWKTYAERRGIALADVAELQEDMREQRKLDFDKRSLFWRHKGDL